MLDTNMVSALVREPRGSVRRRFDQFIDESCISIVAAAEIRFGIEHNPALRGVKNIEEFLSSVFIAPFETPADAHYGRIRAHLAKRGTPIGPNDLFIAAHALALDLTLITANIREFSRVPELRFENWLD